MFIMRVHVHYRCLLLFTFVKFSCFSDAMVTNFENDITYEGMCCEVMDICKFDTGQPFTIKWVDEDGKWLFRIYLMI